MSRPREAVGSGPRVPVRQRLVLDDPGRWARLIGAVRLARPTVEVERRDG